MGGWMDGWIFGYGYLNDEGKQAMRSEAVCICVCIYINCVLLLIADEGGT